MTMKFLSKKSIHVRRLDNIAKVARAEARQKEELTRMAELRREREEERDLEELRKAQEASGRVEKTARRLEWMYKAPQMQKEDENIDDSKEKAKADYEALPDESKLAYPKLEAINNYQIPGSHFLTNARPSIGERDMKLREDPFTQIMNRKREAEAAKRKEEELIRSIESRKKRHYSSDYSSDSDESYRRDRSKERRHHRHHHHHSHHRE